MAKILLNAAAKYRTYASAKFRVLWIRIGFNADPDPAFYINADPDPRSQTIADPCGSLSRSLSDFKVKKI
jgi:hypothetical protein